MKKIFILAATFALLFTSCNDDNTPKGPETLTVDFENVELTNSGIYTDILWGKEQAADDGIGGLIYDDILYSDKGADFGSYYNDFGGTWDTWGGFAFSSNNALESSGDPMDYSDQFNVYAPRTSKFAIAYDLGGWNGGQYERPFITFDKQVAPESVKVANSNKTYHYCSESTLPDFYFTLIITGFNGDTETATVEVELAADGNVLGDWLEVNLARLGTVDKLEFTFESNDSNDYGILVPMFFCIDDLKFQDVADQQL